MAGRGLWRRLCLLFHILPDHSPRVGDVMPDKVQTPGSYTSTHKGGSSFSLQSPKTGFGPIWVTCPLVDQSRWAEERTVVIGSHWFTVLPLTNRVTGKSKILRKDGLFPSDHRAEAMGRGRQKCLTSQEEFPADKLTVPRTHNLVGERNKQGCI